MPGLSLAATVFVTAVPPTLDAADSSTTWFQPHHASTGFVVSVFVVVDVDVDVDVEVEVDVFVVDVDVDVDVDVEVTVVPLGCEQSWTAFVCTKKIGNRDSEFLMSRDEMHRNAVLHHSKVYITS